MALRQLLAVLFVVGLGYQGMQYFKKQKQAKLMQSMHNTSDAKLKLGVPDNCAGKVYCVTAYVAPWCSACKITKTTFKALQSYLPKHRPDVGFGIIVGSGTEQENLAEQLDLNPIETFVDHQGVIFKNRQIQGFPTWIINDAQGKEIGRSSGGLQINSDEQLVLFIKQFLKI